MTHNFCTKKLQKEKYPTILKKKDQTIQYYECIYCCNQLVNQLINHFYCFDVNTNGIQCNGELLTLSS